MPDFNTLEPIDNNYFSIEWETTLKCNLDCSYCGDGHDNNLPHPSLADSLNTLDFIFDYTEIQLSRKPKHLQHANLNIFGGESFYHPKIIDILKYSQKKKEQVSWSISISTITNAVVKPRLWARISEFIDYFTISFHAESTPEQQQLVRDNILYLQKLNKPLHVSIMMHPSHWQTCINMIEWCKENNVKYNSRQIDHDIFDFRFNYNKEQTIYLTGSAPSSLEKVSKIFLKGFDLSSTGRACCGNLKMCTSNCSSTSYIKGNNFKNWHCSVDKFFLYIKQTTGEVFTNKDCRMNYNEEVGPIGYLSNTVSIINNLKSGTPTIVCKKTTCWCGLCAPKAKNKDDYEQIMLKYVR
jgi:sulfatase maturation enzyme AslB (radical SAM superfamily)